MFVTSMSIINNSTIANAATVKYKVYGLDLTISSKATTATIKSMIGKIAPYTNWIRVYGCTGNLATIGKIADSYKLKVAISAKLTKNQTSNAKEIANLIKSAKYADMAIVGNNVLSQKLLTQTQLIAHIKKVQAGTSKPVAVCDTSSVLTTTVMKSADIVLANIYPYKNGIDTNTAMYDFNAKYNALKSKSGGKKVIVGETGWPSSGKVGTIAIPSLENSAKYFLNFVSWARAKKVDYFYYNAFDTTDSEKYGIWTSGKNLKNGMIDVFNGKTVADNWTNKPTPKPTSGPNETPDPSAILEARVETPDYNNGYVYSVSMKVTNNNSNFNVNDWVWLTYYYANGGYNNLTPPTKPASKNFTRFDFTDKDMINIYFFLVKKNHVPVITNGYHALPDFYNSGISNAAFCWVINPEIHIPTPTPSPTPSPRPTADPNLPTPTPTIMELGKFYANDFYPYDNWYIFTPTETRNYYFIGFDIFDSSLGWYARSDTIGELYQDEKLIASDDGGQVDHDQFIISAILTTGTTYKLKVSGKYNPPYLPYTTYKVVVSKSDISEK